MRLLSWNVNGLRACLNKGCLDSLRRLDADVACFQETKMERGQAAIDLPDYYEYWNSAAKKGYSGTAVFSREKPLAERNGMDTPPFDDEGRLITLEFKPFYLVNVYAPNSKRGLLRLDYRMQWEDAFRTYVKKLDRKKPVIICGDMNVAHEEIDIRHPAANHKTAGFTDEERRKMTELLAAGFTDTFRARNPDLAGAYTWWSYRTNARVHNSGWRIDYFLVSNRVMAEVADAAIHADITGSDHCPVSLDINL